jgi:ABC-type transport system involved in cytochrome bd biosynthesis fused ATPase/permease subunit
MQALVGIDRDSDHSYSVQSPGPLHRDRLADRGMASLYNSFVLDFIPKWLLAWIAPLAMVVAVVAIGLGGNLTAAVVAVLAVWGLPLAVIWYRSRRGIPDDQRQVGRMDRLLK